MWIYHGLYMYIYLFYGVLVEPIPVIDINCFVVLGLSVTPLNIIGENDMSYFKKWKYEEENWSFKTE